MIPTRKDIIKVKAPWTKGNNYFYLVDFATPDNEWIGAYRIHFGDYTRYTSEHTCIPQEYFVNGEKKYSSYDGYVNIYTGKCAIHSANVVEIVSALSDEIYGKIASAVFATTMGLYSISESGKYEPKSLDFTIPVKLNIAQIIGQCSNEAKMTKKIETGETERARQEEEKAKNLQIIIDAYNECANEDARVDYIFRIFAEGDKLPIRLAYNAFILNKDSRNNSRSLTVTRSEFMILVTENNPEIVKQLTDFTRANGEKFEGNITAYIGMAKSLYNGKETSIHSDKRVRIDKETIDKIVDLYINHNMSREEIATKLEISYSAVARYTPKQRYKSYNTDAIEYFMNIDEHVYTKYRKKYAAEIEEIKNATVFLKENPAAASIIISGKTLDIDGFQDIDSNILKMMAYRTKHSSSFGVRIACDMSSFVITKQEDFLAILFNKIGQTTEQRLRRATALYLLAQIACNDNINYSKSFDEIIDDPEYAIVNHYLRIWKEEWYLKRRSLTISANERYICESIGFPSEWFEAAFKHF